MLLHLKPESREDELATDVEQPWLGRALTDYDDPPYSADITGSLIGLNGSSNGITKPNYIVCSLPHYYLASYD